MKGAHYGFRTINVRPETKERLEKLAKYGDTMDSVISGLLDEHDKHVAEVSV